MYTFHAQQVNKLFTYCIVLILANCIFVKRKCIHIYFNIIEPIFRGNITSLASTRAEENSDSEDEEGQAFYAGGSERRYNVLSKQLYNNTLCTIKIETCHFVSCLCDSFIVNWCYLSSGNVN